jgi:hypothetical protein
MSENIKTASRALTSRCLLVPMNRLTKHVLSAVSLIRHYLPRPSYTHQLSKITQHFMHTVSNVSTHFTRIKSTAYFAYHTDKQSAIFKVKSRVKFPDFREQDIGFFLILDII